MKKLLIALMGLFIASNALAYTIKINNDTESQIEARIFYTGEGVCAQDSRILEPLGAGNRNKWVKSTGLCCSRYVTFKVTSGKASGQDARQDIEGCKNFTIRVRMTADGRLVPVLE